MWIYEETGGVKLADFNRRVDHEKSVQVPRINSNHYQSTQQGYASKYHLRHITGPVGFKNG